MNWDVFTDLVDAKTIIHVIKVYFGVGFRPLAFSISLKMGSSFLNYWHLVISMNRSINRSMNRSVNSDLLELYFMVSSNILNGNLIYILSLVNNSIIGPPDPNIAGLAFSNIILRLHRSIFEASHYFRE